MTPLTGLGALFKHKTIVLIKPFGCVADMALLAEIRLVASEASFCVILRPCLVCFEPDVFRLMRRRFLPMAVVAECQSIFVARHALFLLA